MGVAPEDAARVEDMALRFVEDLPIAEPGSAAFARALRSIDQLGDRELRATAQICSRLGNETANELRGLLGDDAPLSRHVREVQDLAKVRDAARRDDRIRALAQAIETDRAELAADNARLSQEERALFHHIGRLRQYALLAARIDELLEGKEPSADIVHAVRQRRRDLLLQLAVASQAYASVRLIEQRNLDVIWALRSAATTTISALRAAGMAQQLAAEEGWSEVRRVLAEVDTRRRRALAES